MVGTETPSVPASPKDQAVVVGAGATSLGAALTAVVASLCCVGPAGVALLGVGGALAAAELKPYRPILLAVSLGLLAFAFWRSYGRSVMVNGASCPIRVGRFARIVLWISAAIWVLAAILPTG
jgi:mercuric ion transport protein